MVKSLKLSNIRKSYGKKLVVNNLSLEVREGEIVGLLGPNGAGKTTTFHIVIGLIRPEGGSISLNGEEITSLPIYKRARLGMGYLPQEPSIFRKLTVEENIMAILETLKISKKERRRRLRELLKKLELEPLAKNKAFVLSGGERRRLEITRALVISPSFLLLDEPFSGIDPITVSEIRVIIKKLAGDGLGILLTDHNVRETLEITDRSYIIHRGEILISGEARELVESEQ
ncbi:MAG: LPS export ABC transporter ATP-binding protein, partial [Candidatus Omnitrophica bacterium]|nr:LPS export ABC transporter ATP-binding protein [Candidatus Omnitrophota bacterium]